MECKHIWKEKEVETTTLFIKNPTLIPVQCSKCKIDGFFHETPFGWCVFY